VPDQHVNLILAASLTGWQLSVEPIAGSRTGARWRRRASRREVFPPK